MNKINQILITPQHGFKANQVKQNIQTTNPEENQKLSQDLENMSELGKSQINFRGKFQLNKKDTLFLGCIVAGFGLSIQIFDKLKASVSNFLHTNNLTSLDDISGEENMDMQCNLAVNIQEAAQLNDKELEIIVDKIIDEYGNKDEFKKEKNNISLEEMEELIAMAFQKRKNNDKAFIDSISFTFGLKPEERKLFEEIFNKYMADFNVQRYKSLDFFEKVDKTVVFIDAISQALNLSEYDADLIDFEFRRRISMNEDEYFPLIHPIDRNEEIADKDLQVLHDILANYTISDDDYEKLHYAMKVDAYDSNCTSIFEPFQNFTNKHNALNQVLDTKQLKDIKIDLLINLFSAAKNIDKISEEIISQDKIREKQYIKHCAIVYTLDKDFNFSEADIKKLKEYLLYGNIDLNKTNDIWKAAYEIPELINLPNSATDKIAEVIKKVNEMPEDELNDYGFYYCKMKLSKK